MWIDTATTVRLHDIMVQAADLMSEDGENPEYDRALVELVSYLAGASPADYYEDVADLIDSAPHTTIRAVELKQ